MEDNQNDAPAEVDTTTENGIFVQESPWISDDVAAARAGKQVDMGKHIIDEPADTQED